MSDPVARSDALDREIIAIPRDRVFTKRTVVAAFLVVMVTLAAGFGAVAVRLEDITSSTNDAVTQEIPGLKDQVADRDQTIATQEDLLRQAVDAIVLLQGDLRALGVEPREVIIRATTTVPEG